MEGRKVARWGIALGIGVFLSRIPLCGTPDIHFVYYTTVVYGLAWGLGFLAFAWVGSNICDRRFHAAVAVGLFVFLIHDVINFALFVPGSATTFFALLALTLSSRSLKESRLVSTGRRYVPRPEIWVLLLVISVGSVATGSAILSNIYLNQARRLAIGARGDSNWFEKVDSRYKLAARVGRFDPTPCIERARWALSVAAASETLREPALESALQAVTGGIRAHDRHIGFRRVQCQVYRAKAMHGADLRDEYLEDAVQAAEAVTSLYPNDPAGHILLGSTLLDLASSRYHGGIPTDALGKTRKDLAERAIEVFRRALELDEARPEWERIRGLTEREIADIRAKMRRAEELIAQIAR